MATQPRARLTGAASTAGLPLGRRMSRSKNHNTAFTPGVARPSCRRYARHAGRSAKIRRYSTDSRVELPVTLEWRRGYTECVVRQTPSTRCESRPGEGQGQISSGGALEKSVNFVIRCNKWVSWPLAGGSDFIRLLKADPNDDKIFRGWRVLQLPFARSGPRQHRQGFVPEDEDSNRRRQPDTQAHA